MFILMVTVIRLVTLITLRSNVTRAVPTMKNAKHGVIVTQLTTALVRLLPSYYAAPNGRCVVTDLERINPVLT